MRLLKTNAAALLTALLLSACAATGAPPEGSVLREPPFPSNEQGGPATGADLTRGAGASRPF